MKRASHRPGCPAPCPPAPDAGACALSRGRVDGFTLKLVALLTMTIDHTAAALVSGSWYWPMRLIGRLAFPIYCFLLVEGYFHTRSVRRYLGRLLVGFCVAELPFDAALFGQVPDWLHQNVMLTLAIGLLTVFLIDHSLAWVAALVSVPAARPACTAVLQLATALGGMYLADLCHTDYAGGGVLLIVLFYGFRNRPLPLCLLSGLALFCFFGPVELPGILAMLLILRYNHQRGPNIGGRAGQWFFYLYYGLHLAILAVVLHFGA